MPHKRPKISAVWIGAVYALEVYRSDVIVKRRGANVPPPGGGVRKDIQMLTFDSRRRLAFVASNTSVEFVTMITLTYPGDWENDGKEVKRHLAVFLKRLRRFWPGCQYLWFLEFQRRGAPHFHMFVDAQLPEKRADKARVYRMIGEWWYKIVASDDPRHLKAGTRVEQIRKPKGAARYAVKYAMKAYQKIVPVAYRSVGRFWGHSRGVKPVPVGEIRVNGEDTARTLLELGGWEYLPPDERPLYRMLYQAHGALSKACSPAGGIDPCLTHPDSKQDSLWDADSI